MYVHHLGLYCILFRRFSIPKINVALQLTKLWLKKVTTTSRCRGTTISCCVADRRRCLPTTSVTGVQQSTRYCGALPCRHLCMMTPSLYVTRSATSSQCKSSCKTWVRPWSNFLVSRFLCIYSIGGLVGLLLYYRQFSAFSSYPG